MSKRQKLINEIANRIVRRMLTESAPDSIDIETILTNRHDIDRHLLDIIAYTSHVLKEPGDIKQEAASLLAKNITDETLRGVSESEKNKFANDIFRYHLKPFIDVLHTRVTSLQPHETLDFTNLLKLLDDAKRVRDRVVDQIVNFLNSAISLKDVNTGDSSSLLDKEATFAKLSQSIDFKNIILGEFQDPYFTSNRLKNVLRDITEDMINVLNLNDLQSRAIILNYMTVAVYSGLAGMYEEYKKSQSPHDKYNMAHLIESGIEIVMKNIADKLHDISSRKLSK